VGKKYIVAVSGGVDSVALLDMLAQTDNELIVAHFDHGIRDDSIKDADFVKELAEKYGAEFVVSHAKLGKRASENQARLKRYEFLRTVAREHDGRIVTAHHRDDIVESIIFNVRRGTGWRGLAVMNATDIARPLLHMSKVELYDYALKRGLAWREDPTNASDVYARNHIRLHTMPRINIEQRLEFAMFHAAQTALRTAIDDELQKLYEALKREEGKGRTAFSRHFFIMADESPALELLNYIIKQQKGVGLTRPALHRLLLAIKTGRPGSKHVAMGRVTMRLKPLTFVID
jgi:tRNA(Ile)-lysidine synthase